MRHRLRPLIVHMVALPAQASKFVGSWRQIHNEGYDDFLSEAIGLSWMMRKIAVQLRPWPTWRIEDDVLHCHVEITGANPTDEQFRGSEEVFTVMDANEQGIEWTWKNSWEADGTLCSERTCPSKNSGNPIVVRYVVDDASGELVVTQQWAPNRIFTQRLVKEQ